MNKQSIGVLILVSLCIVATASAEPVIDVGNHSLFPNMAGQEIQIFVTGGTPVQGLNFYIQVADGGPEAAALGLIPPPGIDGPAITGLDLLSGTIFEDNNTEQRSGPFLPQFRDGLTSTVEGTVLASGLLATVTFDTTGFTTLGQQWELRLTNVVEHVGTDFATIPATIHNGAITIVPEPSSIVLLLLAAVGMLLVVRLRRA